MCPTAGRLLRQARTVRGLSQRELAAAAGTSQSVIGRIESDAVSPAINTLSHLLATAGFELELSLRNSESAPGELPGGDSHMLTDVSRILALSPEGRLQELANVSRFLASAKRV